MNAPMRWYIPERAPNALPVTSDNTSLLDGLAQTLAAGGTAQRGPLTQLAYQMAGAPPSSTPRAISYAPLAALPDGSPSGGGGGGVDLSALSNIKKGYDALSGGGGDPAIQQPSQLNELGSKVGLTSGLSPGWASGANANNAALSQLNYPSAIGFDSGGLATGYAPAATIAGSLSGIGSGTAANAALAEQGFLGGWATPSVEASLAGASGAGAGAGAAAGSAGAESGVAAGASPGLLGTLGTGAALVGATLAVGQGIHNWVNGRGDEHRNYAAFSQAFPVEQISKTVGRNAANYYKLPDGRVLSQDQMDDLSGAWYGATYAPDGNQSDWLQKYNDLNSSIKGYDLSGKTPRKL